MERFKRELDALIPKVESLRGRLIWLNAPVALTDAVLTGLDGLNEASMLAEKEIERNKQGELAMKALYEMLDKYQAARDAIKGTSDRLDKVQEVCAKCNAGLDQFFADAEAIDAAVNEADATTEEAAPNGALGEDGAAIIEGAV